MPAASDLGEHLRAHFLRERSAVDRHPCAEDLLDYREGRLAAPEEEALRGHLAACPDCTALVLELSSMGPAVEAASRELAEEEVEAAWQRQLSRLGSRRRALRRSPPAGAFHWSWVMAASLALVSVLLGVLVSKQGQTIARLQEAQVNPPLVNLAPIGSLREGRSAPGELRFEPQAARAWVILNPEAELDFASYEVRIVAGGGREVLRLEDLSLSAGRNFRLEVPRGLLPSGEYRILLLGVRPNDRRALEEFALSVLPAPAP